VGPKSRRQFTRRVPFRDPLNFLSSIFNSTRFNEMAIELDEFCQFLTADRKPKQEFSSEARAAIIALSASGQSTSSIAWLFRTRPSSITAVLKTFEKTRNLQSTKRSGRPPIFTRKDAKYAYLLARRYPRRRTASLLRRCLLIATSLPSADSYSSTTYANGKLRGEYLSRSTTGRLA
jgi:hypothetical protein